MNGMVFVLALVAIISITKIVTSLLSKEKEQGRGSNEDETRTLQELHRTLERLETRVDVLETLLHKESRKY